MVATYVKKIKHSLLYCVIGVYLRYTTNTFSPLLLLNESHQSICSSSSVQIVKSWKEKMRLCETNSCARSAWNVMWRSSSTPANILCVVCLVVPLSQCAPSAEWPLRASTRSLWHKHAQFRGWFDDSFKHGATFTADRVLNKLL